MYTLSNLVPTTIYGHQVAVSKREPNKFNVSFADVFEESDLPKDMDSLIKARLWMLNNHPEQYVSCKISYRDSLDPVYSQSIIVSDPEIAIKRGVDISTWFQDSIGTPRPGNGWYEYPTDTLRPTATFIETEKDSLEQSLKLQEKLKRCFQNWAKGADAILEIDPNAKPECDAIAQEFTEIYHKLDKGYSAPSVIQALSKSTYPALNHMAKVVEKEPKAKELIR